MVTEKSGPCPGTLHSPVAMRDFNKYDRALGKRRERSFDAAAVAAMVTASLTTGSVAIALAFLSVFSFGCAALTAATNRKAEKAANKSTASSEGGTKVEP